MLTVTATVIKRNDKLYNETIVDYSGIAVASVNIGILRWISRHIEYLNSH